MPTAPTAQDTPQKLPALPPWKQFVAEASRGEAFQRFLSIAREAIRDRKTRKVKLIGRRCIPQIYKTFLGYEIIGARKRVLCPDMTTARYLRIFAEIGLKETALPYDVTRTQEVLPELERAYVSLKRILDFFVDQLLSGHEKNQFLRGVYSSLQAALTASPPEVS
jgi:hypothetical protein